MIQVGAKERKVQDPVTQDLMKSLITSWEGISNEHNASEVSLKQSFEKEFAAGEKQYAALLQNQTQLNATIAEMELLNQKLLVSVAYLEKALFKLREKRSSLKQFA